MRKRVSLYFVFCILFLPCIVSAEDVYLSPYRDTITNIQKDFLSSAKYTTGTEQEICLNFVKLSKELEYVISNAQFLFYIQSTASKQDVFLTDSPQKTILILTKSGIKSSIKRIEDIIDMININLSFSKNNNSVYLGNQLKTKARELIEQLNKISL